MAISTEFENAKNLLKSNKDYLISKLNQYGSYLSKDNYHYNCFRCGSKDNLSILEKDDGTYSITCFSINKGTCDIENWDIINLVSKMENISFKEAVEKLCQEFGISLEVNNSKKSNTAPKTPKKEEIKEESEIEEPKVTEKQKEEINNFILQAHENVKNTDYLHNRGFTDETINKYKLGFMPNYKFKNREGGYSGFGDVAVIPYPGESYYTLRWINPPKWLKGKYKKLSTQEAGQEPIFNLKELAHGYDPVYIVEGQIDCLSLIQIGAACIGLNGVGGVNKLVKLLEKNKEQHRPFIIALDDDEAGKGAKEKLIKELNKLNVYYYVCDFPKDIEGVKDPNDLLVKDKDKLQELITIASEKALNEFKEFKIKQNSNKIYGDYEYLKSSNKLFKIDMKASTDGQPMKDYKFIYDGMIRITGITINIDTDIENIILSSKMDFEVEKEFEKGILLGSINNFTKELNNKNGFRVKPDNAVQKRLQNYIYDQYEGKEKDKALNEKYITERIGFIKNNKQRQKIDTFVYPNSSVTLGDNLYYIEDGNYNKIFTSKGTTDEWIENILKPSLASDNLKVMLLGTFASILIEPLGAHENFIIELSGNTGTSKTTALNVCASVFGEPTKYITDWRTTSTAAISKASEINVFPLMLDDTKKCDDKKIISSLVYSLSSGRDKARSDLTGKAREVKTFKNITLTTGEVPLHDYLTEGRGALSRFIPLEGGALEKSNTNKLIADKLNIDTHKYYGTIGFEFVKWLIKKLKDADFMSMTNDLYLTYMQKLPQKVDADNEMAQRRCNHVALLAVTGYVLEDFFGQDYFDYENLINNLVKEINQNSKETDVIEAAYIGVMEYCTKNSISFYKESDINEYGVINERTNIVGQYKDNLYMFYSKADLIKIIEEYGDATDILRNFRDRNYLITNKGASQFAKTVKKLTDKKPKKMYVINPGPYQEAIEKEKELEEKNQETNNLQETFDDMEIPF